METVQLEKGERTHPLWQEILFMILVASTMMGALTLFHSFRYLIGR